MGSLTRRKDGRWMARFFVTLPNGERERRQITRVKKLEAARLMHEMMVEAEKGLLIADNKQTVAQWLHYWLAEIDPNKVKDSTLWAHRTHVEKNIIPEIGGIRLTALKPDHVRRMIASWDKRGVGTRSQQNARNALSTAINDAMKLEYVHRNVVRLVDPPKHVPKQRHVWTAEQARIFITAIEKHRYYGLFLVLFCFGLRRGEATGLRWGDVDFAHNLIQIRQAVYYVGHIQKVGELKTPESRRILAMPSIVREALLDEYARRGNPDKNEFLYLTTRGNPVDGRTFIQLFYKITDFLELPRITLHEIRHTVATLLFERNVPAKTAQGILGHKSIVTTLQVYTHSTSEQRAEGIAEVAGMYT